MNTAVLVGAIFLFILVPLTCLAPCYWNLREENEKFMKADKMTNYDMPPRQFKVGSACLYKKSYTRCVECMVVSANSDELYGIVVKLSDGKEERFTKLGQYHCSDTDRRLFFADENIPLFAGENKQTKEIKMGVIKEYFNKHRDALMTLGVIVLIDHFIFGGAFREKIKTTIEAILAKTQKKLTDDKEAA